MDNGQCPTTDIPQSQNEPLYRELRIVEEPYFNHWPFVVIQLSTTSTPQHVLLLVLVHTYVHLKGSIPVRLPKWMVAGGGREVIYQWDGYKLI